MSDNVPLSPSSKPKSFWKRPEGITGFFFFAALLVGGGILVAANLQALLAFFSSTLALAGLILALGLLIYVVADPKMRNLVWYMYKSVMRTVTGWFVQLDPIGVLKSYVEDLEDNLVKMRKQIGVIRGQQRKLQTLVEENEEEIEKNMKLASAAKAKGMDAQVTLSSRKAARLKESNAKYQALLNKMDVLYRILNKMHANSEVLLEDTRDQVKLKEQERKAIRASHSAMKSAMSVISGDPDKRAMFDAAMESITDDVANKVGEMERFMEMSSKFMESVDLQNGIFEEEGLEMLERWERESSLMLLESGSTPKEDTLDLNDPVQEKEPQARQQSSSGSYDNLFK